MNVPIRRAPAPSAVVQPRVPAPRKLLTPLSHPPDYLLGTCVPHVFLPQRAFVAQTLWGGQPIENGRGVSMPPKTVFPKLEEAKEPHLTPLNSTCTVRVAVLVAG